MSASLRKISLGSIWGPRGEGGWDVINLLFLFRLMHVLVVHVVFEDVRLGPT